jgi:outer membrane protein assembly factor BamB
MPFAFALLAVIATAVRVDTPPQSSPPAPRRLRSATSRCVSNCNDWAQFSETSAATSISTTNVATLHRRWRVETPETVEGSPLFVQRVGTRLGSRNLLIVETSAGRLIALDAASGFEIWSTTGPAGQRWTTSTPALDPNRTVLYAYGLDGYVHKYAVGSGVEITGNGWPELITLKGDVEKGSSALTIATTSSGDDYLYVTTSAYPDPGDAGDYQGHLVAINLATGTQRVFNAACSDAVMHFVENGDATTDCATTQGGIWARAGAVYDARTDRVYVTVGNGVFDADRGGFNWATSVVAVRPDGSTDGGTPLDSYTPANYQYLNDQDLDLSSTAVAPLVLPADSTLPPLAVQGGKDGQVRLLDLSNLSGAGAPRHLGGELQMFPLPQGGWIITRPAVWLDANQSYTAIANDQGVSAFVLTTDSGAPRLKSVWTNPQGCQTPVYAKGILFCAQSGRLTALSAATGNELWSGALLDNIHWQSPIVIGDSVYVADSSGVSAFGVR